MNRLQKFLAMPAAMLVTAGMMTMAVSAAAIQQGTVKVGTYLNVRQAGNTGSPVIGRVYNGTTVTVLENDKGWYEISYNGGTAWVNGDYVALTSVSAHRQAVVSAAKSQLGVRYVFGGTSSSGFDCSGLTMYAYRQIGITLPHSAAAQAGEGVAVSRSALQPGDLLFFATSGGSTITHVGVYEGGGIFISAQSGAGMVKEASLSNSYWSAAYRSARRILE